jgi:VIT1/CCC1 family predicted Fe2+/Mn2+ transporter
MVRDIVIGMADGLTVPFALAAGLSGAVISSQLITTAGLAEIVAGSVAMGLGGYLAVNGDEDHYARERFREQSEVQFTPEQEVAEIVEIFAQYGVSAAQCAQVIEGLRANREAWVNFMMRFELGLEPPKPGRAGRSAATIACAYIAGGLIPITPYFMAEGINALIISAGVTLLALGGFGYLKGYMTGTPRLHSAMQTLLVGGTAAAAAFVLARAVT